MSFKDGLLISVIIATIVAAIYEAVKKAEYEKDCEDRLRFLRERMESQELSLQTQIDRLKRENALLKAGVVIKYGDRYLAEGSSLKQLKLEENPAMAMPLTFDEAYQLTEVFGGGELQGVTLDNVSLYGKKNRVAKGGQSDDHNLYKK